MSTVSLSRKTVLSLEHTGIPMTPREFDTHEDWDDNYRYELIGGRLIVSPIPLESERDPNEELGHWLRTYKDDHPQGSALDKTLPEHTVRCDRNRRRADRVIWCGLGRIPNPRRDVPNIVAEFVSRARRDQKRDYVDKRKDYRKARVQEYWIADRFRRIVTVIRNLPKGQKEIVVKENEIYRTPLLPGFELPLAKLLAIADAWGR